MSKYIDLADRIRRDVSGGQPIEYLPSILEWLDRNSGQVPGRTVKPTVTVSEVTEAAGTAHADLVIRCIEYMDLATVVPDPEPTNAEKLEEDLRSALRESGISLGYTNIDHVVEYLDSSGWSKAPGGDNAEKARSDAEWALNIDRQGGA